VKVVARSQDPDLGTHPACSRLRNALREFFPAALQAFDDLTAGDALELLTKLLTKAPDPDAAARLTLAQINAALKRAHRHHVAEKARVIQAALRSEQLRPRPRSAPRTRPQCARRLP
jgi:hypothetical protein